jgi:putative spermidine/putrescine transport system permease protein
MSGSSITSAVTKESIFEEQQLSEHGAITPPRRRRRIPLFAWLIFIAGAIYFILPLYGTFIFSLQKVRDTYSFAAYASALTEPAFIRSFLFSNVMAVCTIIASLLLVVPTAYWVQLKVPKWRQVVEFISLLPFVIPAIVLVFGMIKIYSRPLEIAGITIVPALTNSTMGTNFLLIAAYTVLSLPYMYRSVDNGLRAMDVRTLTEAAQSLGAGWPTILFRIIFPNLRSALLSGALLTFAIVVGELTLASFLNRPAFGPYLAQIGNSQVYEPAALSIVTFALTWLAMILINIVTGTRGQSTVAGAH